MKPRVLLVDDEPDLLELLTFNLLRRGFEVITASEGFEAIRSARREIPHVIVLDLMLPDIDGFSVAGKASKSTNWNHASAAFRTEAKENPGSNGFTVNYSRPASTIVNSCE